MSRQQPQLIDKIKTQMYHAWGAWAQTFNDPYDYILILASARSGSTLLAHILSSNPEILGMGESKIALRREQDYRRLTGKNLYFHWRNNIPREGDERYILDKLVHNYLLDPQDIDLLRSPRVRTIFLLREPRATMSSYMRAVKADQKAAANYLVKRLAYLEQYARELAPQKTSLFLTYRELLHCTQPVLELTQAYLQLRHPLSEQYEVTSVTGNFGLGDKSERIKSGRIVGTTRPLPTQFAPEFLIPIQEAYRHCVATLKENCLHIKHEKCVEVAPPAGQK